MLKNDALDRLESHWAVTAIPEEERKECFKTIEKIRVQKAVSKCIGFNFNIKADWNDSLSRIALAYEIPAIENISSFPNYADESCDRELFSAAAWRCFDLHSVMAIPQNINEKIFLHYIFVPWRIAEKDGMI